MSWSDVPKSDRESRRVNRQQMLDVNRRLDALEGGFARLDAQINVLYERLRSARIVLEAILQGVDVRRVVVEADFVESVEEDPPAQLDAGLASDFTRRDLGRGAGNGGAGGRF